MTAQLVEQRRQYENRIAELKDAHEQRHAETLRTIKALAEEVEYLRAQHFGAVSNAPASFSVDAWPEPDFMPSQAENPHWITEEQEDVEALLSAGLIDRSERNAALEQLQARFGVPIQIDSP